ncbi:unnamed protein product [Hydatigera taeniaeformis]|uniref:Uncharacterized protein n=1 Tax=Hydatigena taeniaeformis TaxID=6205 RepID=A0A0R3XD59_HYDTA|nr:unnamed protein product [Hydatigera taeniaeformis]
MAADGGWSAKEQEKSAGQCLTPQPIDTEREQLMDREFAEEKEIPSEHQLFGESISSSDSSASSQNSTCQSQRDEVQWQCIATDNPLKLRIRKVVKARRLDRKWLFPLIRFRLSSQTSHNFTFRVIT